MGPNDGREALRSDYDEDPQRFRTARRVLAQHGLRDDVHSQVAKRLLDEGLAPVLDVGCGEGELARHLPAGAWYGVDNSATMLAAAPRPHVLAEATALPFDDDSFPAVALLYVLYHLADPRRAIEEAYRVLRPGGLVAVAAPSRHDSPELAHALPDRELSFDAELVPELLGSPFVELEVESWNAPLVELRDRRAVRDYLVGKGVGRERAAAAATSTRIPLRVTKRGALAFARKSS